MRSVLSPGKRELKRKLNFLGGGILLVFFIFTGYLFKLQVVEKIIWEGRAEAVARRSEQLVPQRGFIWDRHADTPLALNIDDSFAVFITPAEIFPTTPAIIDGRISRVLNTELGSIEKMISNKWRTTWNQIEIADGISYEGKIVQLAESKENYPGLSWLNSPYRWYTDPGALSHILGYVGNITTEELQILYNRGYENTSSLGKSGMEKIFDNILRGKSGRMVKTVDVRGRVQGKELVVSPPENGLDIVLTIDRRIQDLAEKALGPRKGSLIVLNPSTGEILAMVSYPSFDPNNFKEPSLGNFKKLRTNKDFPFLNRAIQSTYPPASTFKLVVGAALLGENAVDPAKQVNCRGSMVLGDRTFYCYKRSGHGLVNLRKAIEISCNIYFGTMGVKILGIETISEYARKFGLGSRSGIVLDGEVSGTVPDKAWKEDVYGVPWTGGDTLNSSIGQGFFSTTPLQMANVIAGLVNKGVIYRPRLLKEVRRFGTSAVVEKTEPEILRTIEGLDDTDYDFLLSAMRGVVTEGTGKWALYTQSVEVGGKTGTGEIGREGSWHDWFVAFAPYKTKNPNPNEQQVVVVTMIEATDTYDWWAPKATDIVLEGIFENRTYEEVIKEWQQRGVWWSWSTKDLPKPGYPYVSPVAKVESEE